MDEKQLEELMQAKGLNAPRLTPAHIDAQIHTVHYHRVPNTTTTICTLVLRNGFTITETSACVSAANFDETIGRELAYKKARERIWDFEGYLLASVLNPKVATVKERVENEANELRLKYVKLMDFLNLGRPPHLSEYQWGLLEQQYEAMGLYLAALDQRLITWISGD